MVTSTKNSDGKNNDVIELRESTRITDTQKNNENNIEKSGGIVLSVNDKCDDAKKREAKRLNSIDALNRDTFDTPVLESRPPSNMWLAICTTIFFNPLIGIIAMVMAFQADNEYIQGNTPQARKLGRIVKILCIASIVITLFVVAILSIFLNIDVAKL